MADSPKNDQFQGNDTKNQPLQNRHFCPSKRYKNFSLVHVLAVTAKEQFSSTANVLFAEMFAFQIVIEAG